jgi:hypothetical protein
MGTAIRDYVRRHHVALIAIFLALGGTSIAAFDPIGGDGDIDACYERKSGQLSIQKGKKCPKQSKPVAWAQEGPRGPAGPQGRVGDPGTPGEDFAYERTIIVSPAETPIASGQALVDAVASITDAAADKPYLVRMEPGTYEVAGSVGAKPFVSIEGSGVRATSITRPAGGGAALLNLGAGQELRDLAITTEGGNGQAVASSGPIVMRSVDIDVAGETSAAAVTIDNGARLIDVAIEVTADDAKGLVSSAGELFMRGVSVHADGAGAVRGLFVTGGSLTAQSIDVTAGANAGSVVYFGAEAGEGVALRIDSSAIDAGAGSAFQLFSPTSSASVGATRIDAATLKSGSGSLDCGASYDSQGNPVVCP